MKASTAPLLTANAARRLPTAWPNAEQILLLRAALAEEPAEALACWERWRQMADFENLDYGSHRLLPLLQRNLVRHGAGPHPWLGRMKGLHRHTWVRNQQLFAGLSGLVRALRAELDSPVMLLKGAALALQAYPDMGLRPMEDCDFLVPRAAAPAALVLLERHGWRPVAGWAMVGRPIAEMSDYWRQFSHAQNFVFGDERSAGQSCGVDLHWRALADTGTSGELNENLWLRASAGSLPDGTPVLLPAPTDLLCQVCLHGLRANDVPPVRWAADAAILLRQATAAGAGSQAAIDWTRLQRFAVEHAVTKRLGATLDFLAQALGLPVPADVLAGLRARPVSPAEEKEFAMLVQGLKPMEIGLTGRPAYQLHRLRSSGRALTGLASWRHAAEYFCGRWRVRSPVWLPLGVLWVGLQKCWRLVQRKLAAGSGGARDRNQRGRNPGLTP